MSLPCSICGGQPCREGCSTSNEVERVREAGVYKESPRDGTKISIAVLPCVLCGEIVEYPYTVETEGALKHAADQSLIAEIALGFQEDRALVLIKKLKEHYLTAHITPRMAPKKEAA